MPSSASSPSHRGPVRALVVEDAEDEAFLLYSELASRGLRLDYERVDTAAAMREALAGGEWDVIICDHNMPGFDSFAALRLLKETGKDIPFIIYSGQISDQQAVSAMQDGVHDAIEKGNYARLLPVIERELRNAETRRAVREADGRIQELAFYDDLSNLPNKNLFCAMVTEWIFDAERSGHGARGFVLCLDLDRFTRINGSFGYETGNAILREAAQRLAACLPAEAVVARTSGDAFAIFGPGVGDRQGVEAVVAAVRRAFDAPFRKGHLEFFVTVSIGVARLPDDGNETYQLLMQAEMAMEHVQRRGGNGVEYFRREMNETHADRVALEADLRHAIERDELFLQYQPCIDTASGRMVGVEALLRWHHPRRGLIPPDRFIPVADESGTIVDIGRWVLNRACRQGRVWQDQGHDLYVAINVSAVQFGQPRLLEDVSIALAESGFAPRNLQLEITESVLMQDAESAVGMLRSLNNMGVRISIDDFGTGYSSLSYLKRFPIDILKIDRSFVRDLATDEDDAAIVRAIIALAHTLRLSTVGEGVETPEQAEFLRREACDRLQGFLFSRPVDAGEIQERLDSEGAK